MRLRRPPSPIVLAALLAVQWAVVAGTALSSDATASGTVAALVLAPCSLLLTAALGARIGGRGFAVPAAAAFLALPLLGLVYFTASYRDVYVDGVLAPALGLRDTHLLVLALALTLAAAVLPGRAAAAAAVVVLLSMLAARGIDRDGLSAVKLGLHEQAWSVGLAEWLPIAGVVGVARRSRPWGLALGAWFGAALVNAAHEPFDGGGFWRALVPALPAMAVLGAGIGLLVPRLRAESPTARADAS